MLYVIAAPSGAGKTTIVREILKDDADLVFSVSATTRKKRENETEGKDYFYFTKGEFESKIANKELVEYETLFNGDYYGTLKSFVNENLQNSRSIIFDIDVNGALNIKKIYGDKAVLIFSHEPQERDPNSRLNGTRPMPQTSVDAKALPET